MKESVLKNTCINFIQNIHAIKRHLLILADQQNSQPNLQGKKTGLTSVCAFTGVSSVLCGTYLHLNKLMSVQLCTVVMILSNYAIGILHSITET